MSLSSVRLAHDVSNAVPTLVQRFIGMRSEVPDPRPDEIFWDDFVDKEKTPGEWRSYRNLQVGAQHISEYFITQSVLMDDAADEPEILDAGMLDKFLAEGDWTREINPFWQVYKPYLQPIIQNSIMQWIKSRALEKSTDLEQLQHAYHARLRWVELWPNIIYLFWESLKTDDWTVVHTRSINQCLKANIAFTAIMNYKSQDDWIQNRLKVNGMAR